MNVLLPSDLEEALGAVGELLHAEQQEVGIVVVGGAALDLLGVVSRATKDIDVLALAQLPIEGRVQLYRPDPFPEALERAILRVARDFGLPEDWMNHEVGEQWNTGLPPGLEERVKWTRYGGLHVGLAGRADLIHLKLFAAADHSAASVHAQDLLVLAPSDEELSAAAAWVREQDPSEGFSKILDEVMEHVRRNR